MMRTIITVVFFICYFSGFAQSNKNKNTDSTYEIITPPEDILVLIPINDKKTAYYITTGGEEINMKIVDNKLLNVHVNTWYSQLKERTNNGEAQKHYVPVYIKPYSSATEAAKTLMTYILYQNKIKRYSFQTITPEEEALVNALL